MEAARTSDLLALVASVVDKYADELVEFRRDIHAHPELSWAEQRTCDRIAEQLERSGWRISRMPRSGIVADLGATGPRVALRADIDALPVDDLTTDPWRSKTPGVAHSCGHDIHTTALVGAAHALAEAHRQGLLAGQVRLLFQPAEEVMPGGAKHLINHGALEGVDRIFALHCDPSVDVGAVGLRAGPITSAADMVEVRLAEALPYAGSLRLELLRDTPQSRLQGGRGRKGAKRDEARRSVCAPNAKDSALFVQRIPVEGFERICGQHCPGQRCQARHIGVMCAFVAPSLNPG